jgi:hypothetical protein
VLVLRLLTLRRVTEEDGRTPLAYSDQNRSQATLVSWNRPRRREAAGGGAQWSATNKPMMPITPAIATPNATMLAGPSGTVQKANEAPPDALLHLLHRCKSLPALPFQRRVARRAPQTPCAMWLPFACQFSMTAPFRPVLLLAHLLANYSGRGMTGPYGAIKFCPKALVMPRCCPGRISGQHGSGVLLVSA